MNKSPQGRQQRFYLLVIAASVMVVYISAIYADYLPIDDGGILQSVQSGKISIINLFLGGGAEYYRPLAILSLLGDFYLLGGKIAGYHLVNILLHLCNALLVYKLAMLYIPDKETAPFYAFLAGLLFALHPINTETVVWIACRPDLLCCFFGLLSLITVFSAEKHSVPVLYSLLFIFSLCSLLAKEAAFFLPIVFTFHVVSERKKLNRQKIITLMSALLGSVFLYLLLRKGAPYMSTVHQVTLLENGIISNLSAIDAVAAFGFYISKLLYPFPLNFTITKINTLLSLSLLPIFATITWFLWKKDPAFRFPLVFLATSLIPPIGAMLLLPLWVPYAERYLYLPSIAISLIFVMLLHRFSKGIPRLFLATCILALALPTAFRVRLWTEPLLFWQDSAKKAPNFGTARLVLASEYLKAGQYAHAEDNLRQAERLGFPSKSRKAFLEIREQLDEKTGVSAGMLSKQLPARQSLVQER